MGPQRVGEIDFTTFVISLATNAAMQLDPSHKNFSLSLAKQTIEILAMLEQKTAGNLSSDEENLVRGVLYQTRLAYCEVTKAGASTPTHE